MLQKLRRLIRVLTFMTGMAVSTSLFIVMLTEEIPWDPALYLLSISHAGLTLMHFVIAES